MKNGYRIDLICLDFDGTIVVYEDDAVFFHPDAVDLLNELGRRGIRWCTNSGRDVEGQRAILSTSRERGLEHLPEALLCSESYIFDRQDDQYVENHDWNSHARTLQRRFHRRLHVEIEKKLKLWRKAYNLEEIFLQPEATTFLVGGEDAPVSEFQARVASVVERVEEGFVTRNGGWVAAFPEALGKGNTLRQFLHETGVDGMHVLAVGDHHNDLPMLDGRVCRHVGCPGDAIPEVVRAVKAADGYVAAANGPLGTVEIISRFVTGSNRMD